MRKLTLLGLLFIPSIASAERFGSIRSNADVPLSTQTIRNQDSLQSGATFYVSSGSVKGKFTVLDSVPITGRRGFITSDVVPCGSDACGEFLWSGPDVSSTDGFIVGEDNGDGTATGLSIYGDQKIVTISPNAQSGLGGYGATFMFDMGKQTIVLASTASFITANSSQYDTERFLVSAGSDETDHKILSAVVENCAGSCDGTYTTNFGVTTGSVTTNVPLVNNSSMTLSGGYLVQNIAPSNGQVLKFDGTNWAPGTDGGGGGVSVYPATSTAFFPYGFSASTAVLTANSSTIVPLTIQGAASQSVDLTQWKNNSGDILTSVASNGTISSPFGSGTVSNERFGAGSGRDATTGGYNAIFGQGSGTSLTSGVANTIIGTQAGTGITTGFYNVVIGQGAGSGITTGIQNFVMGTTAGTAIGGANSNVLIGYGSGFSLTGGSNIGIGAYALSGTSGVSNVGIGPATGFNLTTGHDNTLIGWEAGYPNSTDATYSTYVGVLADGSSSLDYAGGYGYRAAPDVDNEFAFSHYFNYITFRQISSVQNRPVGEIQPTWATSTDASRKGRLILGVHDAGTSVGSPREGLRIESDGAYALTAFGGLALSSTSVAVYSPTASFKGLIVKGAASQTANLTEWQNNSGVIKATVTANGDISGSSITAKGGAGYFIGTTPIIVSTFNSTSYIGYALYITSGSVAANTTITISTTTMNVSALGIPICSELETTNTAAVSVRVKSLSGLPNSFDVYNADVVNNKNYICYVAGKPL